MVSHHRHIRSTSPRKLDEKKQVWLFERSLEQLAKGNLKTMAGRLAKLPKFEQKAYVNRRYRDTGDPALFYALKTENSAPLVQALLQYRADVTMTNTSGDTPLHVACAKEDVNAAVLLLEHHADSEQVNMNSKTCFQMVANVRARKAFEDRVQHRWKAHSKKITWHQAMNALEQKPKLLTLFLQTETHTTIHDHINYRDPRTHEYPIMRVLRHGDPFLLELLIAKNADVHVYDADSTKNTALHLACKSNELECISVLLTAGAKHTVLNARNKLPYQMADSIEGEGDLHKYIETILARIRLNSKFQYNLRRYRKTDVLRKAVAANARHIHPISKELLSHLDDNDQQPEKASVLIADFAEVTPQAEFPTLAHLQALSTSHRPRRPSFFQPPTLPTATENLPRDNAHKNDVWSDRFLKTRNVHWLNQQALRDGSQSARSALQRIHHPPSYLYRYGGRKRNPKPEVTKEAIISNLTLDLAKAGVRTSAGFAPRATARRYPQIPSYKYEINTSQLEHMSIVNKINATRTQKLIARTNKQFLKKVLRTVKHQTSYV